MATETERTTAERLALHIAKRIADDPQFAYLCGPYSRTQELLEQFLLELGGEDKLQEWQAHWKASTKKFPLRCRCCDAKDGEAPVGLVMLCESCEGEKCT